MERLLDLTRCAGVYPFGRDCGEAAFRAKLMLDAAGIRWTEAPGGAVLEDGAALEDPEGLLHSAFALHPWLALEAVSEWADAAEWRTVASAACDADWRPNYFDHAEKLPERVFKPLAAFLRDTARRQAGHDPDGVPGSASRSLTPNPAVCRLAARHLNDSIGTLTVEIDRCRATLDRDGAALRVLELLGPPGEHREWQLENVCGDELAELVESQFTIPAGGPSREHTPLAVVWAHKDSYGSADVCIRCDWYDEFNMATLIGSSVRRAAEWGARMLRAALPRP